MRYARIIFAALISCLAGVFANGPADAAVFAFNFGLGATGTFTTDGPAADPGYDLITGLTFDVLKGTTVGGVDFSLTDQAGSDFTPGTAFNPTTDAFINHTFGIINNDIGTFITPATIIGGESFSVGSTELSGNLSPLVPDNIFSISGPLVITEIPEASTWAMMLLGFGGLGLAAFRRRRSAARTA